MVYKAAIRAPETLQVTTQLLVRPWHGRIQLLNCRASANLLEPLSATAHVVTNLPNCPDNCDPTQNLTLLWIPSENRVNARLLFTTTFLVCLGVHAARESLMYTSPSRPRRRSACMIGAPEEFMVDVGFLVWRGHEEHVV
jgi:hypothetical protein